MVQNNARPGDVANLIIQRDALLAMCKKAEAALRSFAATSDDPAAALIAQSPEAGALDLAEELAEVIGKAGDQ